MLYLPAISPSKKHEHNGSLCLIRCRYKLSQAFLDLLLQELTSTAPICHHRLAKINDALGIFMFHNRTPVLIRLISTALIILSAAGCANQTVQNLKVSPTNTISPSVSLHKTINEHTRWIATAQHFSGRSENALTLREQRAGSTDSNNFVDQIPARPPRSAQQFYYEDIQLTGHSVDEESQDPSHPRIFSARADHSLIQSGIIVSPRPHRRVYPEFGALIKLSRTQIDATETNADQTPTEFRISFDSKSLGVTGILTWSINEHLRARLYSELFHDPFDDLQSHKTGVNLLVGAESGVELGLFRYSQSDKRSLSKVEFSPIGIQIRLNWQL